MDTLADFAGCLCGRLSLCCLLTLQQQAHAAV